MLRKILIADDDVTNCIILGKTLCGDYDVVEMVNDRWAPELIQGQHSFPRVTIRFLFI